MFVKQQLATTKLIPHSKLPLDISEAEGGADAGKERGGGGSGIPVRAHAHRVWDVCCGHPGGDDSRRLAFRGRLRP